MSHPLPRANGEYAIILMPSSSHVSRVPLVSGNLFLGTSMRIILSLNSAVGFITPTTTVGMTARRIKSSE